MATHHRQQRKPAIYSQDWGSTAIRGSILPRHPGALLREVWNQHPYPWVDERYQEGAFCSNLYLNDDGIGVYLGEVIDHDRVATPSKPFFAIEPVTSNEFVKAALKGPEAKQMWARIDTGLKNILETVFRQVVLDCNDTEQGGPFYIDEIALAYPLYWTEVERSKYEKLVREVLSTFDDNECKHIVARRDLDDLSYSVVGSPLVARGGTQVWEQEIAAFAVQTLERKRNAALPPSALKGILRHFHQEIKDLRADEIGDMQLSYKDEYGGHILVVPAEKAKLCFWKAMREPLQLATTEIFEAASLSDDVRVVVYGGSGQNSVVQSRIKAACENAGVKPPYFAQNGSRAKETWNVVNGAAYATARTVSVEDFMRKGAAFGIRKSVLKPGARTSDKSPAVDWKSDVAVALDSRSSKPYRTWCTGSTRMKIICDPYSQAGVEKKNSMLDIDRSYDLLELPQPSQGYWKYRLSLRREANTTKLVIRIENMGKAGTRVIGSPIQHSFPLYVDGTSNASLLDVDVNDEGRGFMLSEKGQLKACPHEVIKEQLQQMRRAKSGAGVKRKRPQSRLPGVKPSGHLPPFKRRATPHSAQLQTLVESSDCTTSSDSDIVVGHDGFRGTSTESGDVGQAFATSSSRTDGFRFAPYETLKELGKRYGMSQDDA
ncbi:hypothetical protein CGCVW01_v005663 [Colletotrichum viniferum]|nr:hypothetical protein CGCVW01_v005663 [Colletotrichum viniferum]